MRPVLWANVGSAALCALVGALADEAFAMRVGFLMSLANLAWVIFVMNRDSRRQG